jgi:anti-sigma factor RsiW
MSAFTCVQMRDLAPELALGILGGAERAEALIHLTNCTRCQAYVAELTEAADTIPLLASEHEPPPGFDQRVLARFGAGRRRSTRRWIASIAVAAAAAAILSITIVRVVDANNPVTPSRAAATSTSQPAVAMVQARMVSSTTGTSAGWVYVAGRQVAIAVDYGVTSGTYGISVQPTAASAVLIGDMTITDNRGSWTGTSDVDVPSGSQISLVDAQGNAVCHGTVTGTR